LVNTVLPVYLGNWILEFGGRCAVSAKQMNIGGDGAPPSIKIAARRDELERKSHDVASPAQHLKSKAIFSRQYPG
jgi:hypothetical protein